MTMRVDLSSRVPLYQQIVDDIRLRVANGELRPGDRLEPVRLLANRLRVNTSTVARAYQQLERDGVIQTNRRAGSIVTRSDDYEALRTVREGRLRDIAERALVEALAHGYSLAEVEAGFDLQLAAWHDRRRGKVQRPSEAPVANRLARFAGSHDVALELLLQHARHSNPGAAITAEYVGSLDGLLALLHGEAGLAGAHILDEETGKYNLPILRRLFPSQRLCVITLVDRDQGLMVAPGNPHKLAGLADLAKPGVRFINRQPGSGTRSLLDYRLRLAGVAPDAVQGYRSVAATHLAVAMAVAEGRADVGLGLYAAARAYGLEFIPQARERYDLVMFAEDRQQAPLASLIEAARAPDFKTLVAGLGGYDTARTGEETYL